MADPFRMRKWSPTPFGTYLIHMRRMMHLTQLEVSVMLHVTSQSVSNWEVGRQVPTPDNEARIRAVFAGRARRVRPDIGARI